MKKKIFISIGILLVLFTLTGCGNKKEESTKKNKEYEEMIGSYNLIEIANNGLIFKEDALKTLGYDATLEVKENNTAIMSYNEEKTVFTYDKEYFTNPKKNKTKYTFEKNYLTLEQEAGAMLFQKVEKKS